MSADTLPDDQCWTDLSLNARIRRLASLARNVLRLYPIQVRSLRLHSFATNLLFQVRTDSGERFMLRLAYPGWRTLADLRLEAAWLEALAHDTDIGAPRILPSKGGEQVLPLQAVDVPEIWHLSLMTWVAGLPLEPRLSRPNLEKMGALFARLHVHAGTWQPPSGFATRRFEAFLSRGEPDLLFEGGETEGFAAADREAFLQARQWVADEYAGLDRRDLRIIHCDLWHGNIKLEHGRLRPFDFEDTIWGYRLHDIAMGMLDLLETVGMKRYAPLFEAFQEGYTSLQPWPEGCLEALQIGRLLWKANFTARFAPQRLSALAAAYGETFRRYAWSGELRLPAG